MTIKETPKTSEDFFWESGRGDIIHALQFLVDLRRYVAQLPIPEEGYRQYAHSGDPKPVGGDKSKPAVLDSSYNYLGGNFLSISIPDFTPLQKPPVEYFHRKLTWREAFKKMLNPDLKIDTSEYKVNTGLHSGSLLEVFQKVLEHYGFKLGDTKIGSSYEGTIYVEVPLAEGEDFEKGQRMIQAYVHGNAETVENLHQEMVSAMRKATLVSTPNVTP